LSTLALRRESSMKAVCPLVGFRETFLRDAASERSTSTPKATFTLAECLRFLGCRRIPMMMIAFFTIKSSLVPLIEGLCAQIWELRLEIIGGLRSHL